MKPIYVFTVNPAIGWYVIMVFLLTAAVLFFVLPGVPRALDRTGGYRIAQIRVIAMFGRGIIRIGGAFYRFTLYENYLVVCFFFARSYDFKDIDMSERYIKNSTTLRIAIHGVPVTLTGNSYDIDKFHEALMKLCA